MHARACSCFAFCDPRSDLSIACVLLCFCFLSPCFYPVFPSHVALVASYLRLPLPHVFLECIAASIQAVSRVSSHSVAAPKEADHVPDSPTRPITPPSPGASIGRNHLQPLYTCFDSMSHATERTLSAAPTNPSTLAHPIGQISY